MAEDEIEKFMEKYLLDNPGTEIETRYLTQLPVDMTQTIEVRWLRPETPELPPIIINEVDVVEEEEPPIRIVQREKRVDERAPEPLIIREKPPVLPLPEAKVVYVQNVDRGPEECGAADVPLPDNRAGCDVV